MKKKIALALAILAASCGSIVEPKPPCSASNADWVSHDEYGRVVMYVCR